MEISNIIFGGIGGAIITGLVNIWIHKSKINKPKGKAYEILKKLGKMLKEPEGEYYLTKSSTENFNIAGKIFGEANGEIICTTFNENPSVYKDFDLLRHFKYGGSLVKRLTCRNVCPESDEKTLRVSMQKILEGSKLIIIPENEHITKIDGIFSKLQDDTYLTFIAFRNNDNPEDNTGVVFRDGIAKSFFEYYENIAKKFSFNN